MSRKILSLFGIFIVMVFMQSCSADPDEHLLDRYFQASTLNDIDTLSSMAISPISIKAESYEILSVTEEIVQPATLPDLNKKYLDIKKQVEDSVGITLSTSDELDNAKFEEETARTAAAKRSARAKVSEAQIKYDEQYEKHKNIQVEKNEAEAAADREEEITLFSLGVQELMNVRDLVGDVSFKEITVRVVGSEGTKDYKFFLREYMLRDEVANLARRGRYIIVKIEPLD
ncbi:hypothetical protein ACFLRX_03450 [Acidobacteriota bacterium]